MLAYKGEQRPRPDVARPKSIVPGGEEGEGEKEVEAMWRRWEGAAGRGGRRRTQSPSA